MFWMGMNSDSGLYCSGQHGNPLWIPKALQKKNDRDMLHHRLYHSCEWEMKENIIIVFPFAPMGKEKICDSVSTTFQKRQKI